MIRPLLIQEFAKRFAREFALIMTAALLWAGAKSLTFRWYGNDEATLETFDALLAAGLFTLAASAGSSTFSRTFREGPLRLLEVLPLKRLWVWVVRVLTSMATALAGTGVFLLLDPSILTRQPTEAKIAVAGFALLLFAAGCCLSVLVNANGTVLTGLTGAISFAVFFVMVAVEEYVVDGAAIKGLIAGAAAMWILTPTLLCLSLGIFIPGELDNPRRRWRNRTLGAGVALGGILLAAAAVDARVFEPRSVWRNAYATVSPDGVRVAALQLAGEYARTYRIVFVDTATGNNLTTYEGSRLVGFDWTNDGRFLAFNRASALSYLLRLGRESFDVVRIFPAEEHLLRKTGFRYVNSSRDRQGNLLVVRSASWFGTDSQTALLRLNSSGEAQELLRITTRGYRDELSLSETSDGSLLTSRGHLWLIRDNITELPINLGHFRLASSQQREEVTSLLKQNVPPRSASQGGKYLFGDTVPDFDKSTWLYYLQPDPAAGTARLWAKQNDALEWKEVLTGVPLSAKQIEDLSPQKVGLFTRESYPTIRAGARSGVVAYLSAASDPPHLQLFDLNSGEHFDLGEMSGLPGKGPLRVDFHWAAALRSVILVSRSNTAEAVGFYYMPGSGPPLRLNKPDGPWNLLYAAQSGTQIYSTLDKETGFGVFYAEPSKPARELHFPLP